MTTIRRAKATDIEAVRHVHLGSFPESERNSVAQLAVDLLLEGTVPETISLIGEVGGLAAGHVAFSPVYLEPGQHRHCYILAPLAVLPDHQQHGIGSSLIKAGIQQLTSAGAAMLFVYGDPDYYGRFGFRAETAALFEPPYPLTYPTAWQAIALKTDAETNTRALMSCVAPLQDPELW